MSKLTANRPIKEKPLMSKLQHKAVIKGLKSEKHMLPMLTYLSAHQMDPEFYRKEVTAIEDALLDLYTHNKYGYIAECVYRQWRNSLEYEDETIEPLKVHCKRVPVEEGDTISRFDEKSVSIRVCHFKRILREKYEQNPEEYKREKKMNKISSSSCESKERRGIKRKLKEDH